MVHNKYIVTVLKFIGVLAFWMGVWKAASLLVGESLGLFLPPPERVLGKWLELVGRPDFLKAVLATLLRIFEGFAWGVLGGLVLGALSAVCRPVYALISPLMKTVRAVPVVSFIILVFVFFHVDRIPVFICFLMVMPLVWQSVYDGITGTDERLLEMGRMYQLSKIKTLWYVRLPAAMPSVITTCVSALGLAWKSGVAAEVISAPDLSLGYEIVSAKSDLSYDELFAVTLTVVLLSLIFELLLKTLCERCFSDRRARR